MSSFAKTLTSVPGLKGLIRTPGMGAPPLPGDLGLPQLPVKVGQGFNQGKNPRDEDPKVIAKQIADANTYNKAFVELLNQQSHLTGGQRQELYNAYSVGAKETHKGPMPDNYSSQLSQLTPDQFREQQKMQQQQVEQQQAAPAPAPVSQPPQPVANVQPDTVGATPQAPQTVRQPEQPAATPTVATPTGNVAGGTSTLNADAKAKGGRRGRVATLLTGLGGAVERFGL